MLFHSKNITLKDGTQALLRSPRIEDAQSLLDYLKTTAGETEFVLKYPEECTMTVEQEERFIQSINDSPTNIMIVCEIDGRIAGNCSMSIGGRMKIRHRGSVAIALYQEFWGRGIGTKLFEALIAIGREKGLLQLELEFLEGNERGRALYEKMGFEVVAVKPDAYCLKDGSLRKEYMMMKKL
ncbi:MAG: GNAT family N-acetyltransferase [Clostridia bacterium]|nr:GNAT family N-acetyltransferase [Clostridia bacterium]